MKAAAVLLRRISSSIRGMPDWPPRNTLKMNARESGARKKTLRITKKAKKTIVARTWSSAVILK